jgi:hypothetical protein
MFEIKRLFTFARVILCFCLLFLRADPISAQKTQKQLPMDDEIKLLVTQIDRAMSQYEHLIEQEKALLGQEADTSMDEKLVATWKKIGKAFTDHPERFRTIGGYDLVTLLDDASRNAALVPGAAYAKVIGEIADKKVTAKTDLLVTLAQNANSVGTLLFTVSETASAMYLKVLEWQEETFQGMAASIVECSKMLKPAAKKN